MIVKIKRTETGKSLPLPKYMSDGAAGLDLFADINSPITINPYEIKFIKTGICIELPYGYEAQIRPRSGLALKHGITILNTPGTIDSDYRGEIGIILINLGNSPFTINRGDRIAQMIITRYEKADIIEVSEISDTHRGSNGFGSSGINDISRGG